MGTARTVSYLQLPDDSYVYQILPVGSHLAVSSSDDSVRLLDPASLRQVRNGEDAITHPGITSLASVPSSRFSSAASVFSSGRDCTVRGWDLKAPGQSVDFQTKANPSPYLALACGEHLVAAGTELAHAQACISIWDYRNPSKTLRRYVESHNDDVTDLAFHPSDRHLLLSGSTDALLNIFDTSHAEEDDAILSITNHGSSIHHAGFLAPDAFSFFGISHDERLAIYHAQRTQSEGEDTLESFQAKNFGDVRDLLDCGYVVDIVQQGTGIVLAAGKTSTTSLNLFPVESKDGDWTIDPGNRVGLIGAHGEEIVRSLCLGSGGSMFTGGEDGSIRAWRVDSQHEDDGKAGTGNTTSKHKSKPVSDHRYKPY